jgi:hypothetical protein
MRFTFRSLERLVLLLAVVIYLYAAFTLLAQPYGVSGNAYGLTPVQAIHQVRPLMQAW